MTWWRVRKVTNNIHTIFSLFLSDIVPLYLTDKHFIWQYSFCAPRYTSGGRDHEAGLMTWMIYQNNLDVMASVIKINKCSTIPLKNRSIHSCIKSAAHLETAFKKVSCILISFENLSLRHQKSSPCSFPSSLLHWGIWWERFQQCPKVADLWEMTGHKFYFIMIYSSRLLFCNGNSFESVSPHRASWESYWPSVSWETWRSAPFGKMKELVI